MENLQSLYFKDEIQKIERSEIDEVINEIAISSDTLYDMETSTAFGLSAWFKSYVLSPEFQELDRKIQREVFDHYENAKSILECINKFTEKHRLGDLWEKTQ